MNNQCYQKNKRWRKNFYSPNEEYDYLNYMDNTLFEFKKVAQKEQNILEKLKKTLTPLNNHHLDPFENVKMDNAKNLKLCKKIKLDKKREEYLEKE